jgi:hypothetical protein
MPVVAERVPVAFVGVGAGVGELTWGQMEIWLAMIRQEQWLWLGGRKPLPAGTTVADVADELRYLMTRFPSMRTRLRFDGGGRPTQELFSSGEIALEIFESDPADDDAEQLAAAVEAQYQTAARDYADEWPVRMAVIRRHGTLTHLVAIMCHLATDGAGGQVMLREVAARETAPVTGLQQLEQAGWQRSPAGQLQNLRTVRYWEKVLRSVPPRRFPQSTDRREPRNWTGELCSASLRLAVPAIAERTGADSSPVLLALFAVALGRVTGTNPAVIRPLVHNRFRSSLAGVMCMAAQTGICALDVADITVDEAVARTQRAMLATYKFAYFDPEQLAVMVGRVARDRGPEFGISCYFNDRRSVRLAQRPGTPAALEQARSATTFRWAGWKQNPFELLFLHIDDAPEAIRLSMAADTHCFSPADIEALARTMETVAVQAAFDSAVPTGVSR